VTGKTVELSEPITVDGAEVRSLTMRRPKVRDQILAEKREGSNAEREVAMFANLCEVPEAAIQDLDLGDYFQLQEAYQGFFDSQQTPADGSA